MNWTRVVVGGLVAGFVVNLADFVMHGMIMANTYKRFDQVFTHPARVRIHAAVRSVGRHT